MANTYWQIAAGWYGRNYSDKFVKYGMAFVGGDAQIATMRKVNKGDLIALKEGISVIVAAGEVVERGGKSTGNGDKSWLLDFDGWELPAYCYVDWRVPEKPIATDGLTMGTIKRLLQDKPKKIVDNLLLLPIHSCDPEPAETNVISDDQLLEHLIAEGLRASAADELTNTIRKIRLLGQYYYTKCWWEDVREHETRSFLVIPLLLTLGWSEQQLKIEMSCGKGKIDIACFPKAFKHGSEKECVLIVETKGFASGLDYVQEQARHYTEDFPSCRGVLVTNGYCYKAYIRKEDGTFNWIMPSAYLNLLKPRDRYPLDPGNVDGALAVLSWLLPSTLR